ncbi:SDR family NAD(P)-dependent oxidoreductase [Tardiphaga sp.]|jgi:NAD(P)-dependent dehydrogenase (short-subunit alcohol dehydrogenase family)|uniref:SDR family NAD(P)-dependent oxidoreductase n=1 Tax=Tardiphaga sp. TaxID=1926292 RepID=UPI0037D9A17C
MTHPALSTGSVAVITGGASGIGLAAAIVFAKLGLRVCIVDVDDGRLNDAAGRIAAIAPNGRDDVMTANVDVSDLAAMSGLAADVQQRFGGCDVLMNNAGIQVPTSALGPRDNWERLIGVNLWGVVNGCQAFAPNMIAGMKPGLIINTGSKQGITTPPGNPAYNVSKAGVKAYTEALSHELRSTAGCQVTAHLLIPGFVFTGLTAGDRKEKPAAAWTPEQTVDFMMQGIDAGDFYILCPDNDVPRALDERRMLWAIGDVVENRPALSRWHPDYADAFAEFVKTN